jgi:hypothetical protein
MSNLLAGSVVGFRTRGVSYMGRQKPGSMSGTVLRVDPFAAQAYVSTGTALWVVPLGNITSVSLPDEKAA